MMTRQVFLASCHQPSSCRNLSSLGKLGSGYGISRESGKIEPITPFIEHDVPWIYVHPDPGKNCGVSTMIFEMFKFVPSECMNCWKVVVLPRTVEELFKLYEAQLDIAVPNNWYCKCGIDVRPWTPHNYGGYFYNLGFPQGLKRYNQVRKMVDERISPDVPVVLKRYCTEFELECGPTKQYKRPPGCESTEKLVYQSIDLRKFKYMHQPQYLKDSIKLKWLRRAWKIGDMTCKQFNGGKPFYRPLDTYHDDPVYNPELTKEADNG